MIDLLLFTGVFTFVAGLLGAGMYKDNVRRIISINISTSGVFLALISKSFYNDMYDPIVVAMILTGVVISAAFSVLAVILIKKLNSNTDEKDE